MHIIRLRHPWMLKLKDEGAPADWSFSRKFNCPSGLNDARVLLRVRTLNTGLLDSAAQPIVELNDVQIAPDEVISQVQGGAMDYEVAGGGDFVADVTQYLRPFNMLTVSFNGQLGSWSRHTPDTAAPCFDDVATAELQIIDAS